LFFDRVFTGLTTVLQMRVPLTGCRQIRIWSFRSPSLSLIFSVQRDLNARFGLVREFLGRKAALSLFRNLTPSQKPHDLSPAHHPVEMFFAEISAFSSPRLI